MKSLNKAIEKLGDLLGVKKHQDSNKNEIPDDIKEALDGDLMRKKFDRKITDFSEHISVDHTGEISASDDDDESEDDDSLNIFEEVDVLSKEEIEGLLNAISDNDKKFEELNAFNVTQKKVKIYDFWRPEKLSKDQLNNIYKINEFFARFITVILSAHFRCHFQVHVGAVMQITQEEFIRSIPHPTTLSVISIQELYGSFLIEIDPSVTFSMIDVMCGGKGEPAKINRELTTIEMSLMENVVVKMLGALREAWQTVIDIRPRLGNIETNPQFAQIVAPNEMCVVVTMEVKLNDLEGLINLCMPSIVLERISDELTSKSFHSVNRKSSINIKEREAIESSLLDVSVETTENIARANITVKEIESLKTGDIITFDKYPFINVNGELLIDHNGFNKNLGKVLTTVEEEVSDVI